MDQDSFRQLLQERKRLPVMGSASGFRDSSLAAPTKKTIDASQPIFKPRHVKRSQESRYRDRASERRTGNKNDYAHVEAVLEDFQKRNADNQDKAKMEAQRKYLGGDSDHSILVKGLDFALLEQNKARSSLSMEDIEELDRVYREAAPKQQIPTTKKRTREDLIRELKEQRTTQASLQTAEEEARLLEAKRKGKFKPIGLKPIRLSSDRKKKSKIEIISESIEVEKKRRSEEAIEPAIKAVPTSEISAVLPRSTTALDSISPRLEEQVNDDFDIFTDAGEYEGIGIDDDISDEVQVSQPNAGDTSITEGTHSTSTPSSRWIESDEPLPDARPSMPLSLIRPQSSSPTLKQHGSDYEEEQHRSMRLVPLASSALPSIKDLLAMDRAAGSYSKRRNRKKEKKKGGGSDDE